MGINLVDLLPPEHLCLELEATEKIPAIKEMADMLDNTGKIEDKKIFLKYLLEREELETTGIGDGIALPHGRTDVVREMCMVFARSSTGIDFEALDDKPVRLFFLIAAPKSESTKVLKLLAKISRLLHNKNFRETLLQANSKQQIIDLISKQ